MNIYSYLHVSSNYRIRHLDFSFQFIKISLICHCVKNWTMQTSSSASISFAKIWFDCQIIWISPAKSKTCQVLRNYHSYFKLIQHYHRYQISYERKKWVINFSWDLAGFGLRPAIFAGEINFCYPTGIHSIKLIES